MRYEHEARPLVEQHPYIQEIIERQEKKVRDRNYHRDRIKENGEREELITNAPLSCVTDFWCDKCKEDFRSAVIKQVEIDWSNSSQRIAFYKTKCFKGHWCMRLITDKINDAFWSKSKNIAIDRGKSFNDLLQHYQTNYNLLYGKK